MYSNASQAAATLLIADDHQLYSDGLKYLIDRESSSFQVVGQVYDGREVVALVSKLKPDILLLDINLPGSNGIDIARKITTELPKVKVVILTMYDYQHFAHELKDITIAAFLSKDISPNDLFTCLRYVLAGEKYPPTNLAASKAMLNKEDTFLQVYKLSIREREIISLIRRGYSTPEIARELFISEETVKSHRKNIFTKLRLSSLAELVNFAVEQGL
jgi:DNA-binding NarL/FixJ family response regulator